MQYANNGSLLSYLDQNINKLTWKMKLQYLKDIALHLRNIHITGLVHYDLHGGNIVLYDDKLHICDFGLSRSVNSRESNSTIRGALPFIAPHRKSSIPANLRRSQMFILLVLLCI